ncbi:Beta-hexosaminidase subunit beta [Hondaea fermentalgiana]|uniref:beta-N-acetylhexosaminidase n=1 Tax=Hondaea fermentalgiana TaxID=2315210 RepID=A0A2R5GLH8_9STRA|nr:Beta-hexosaminidase subunit beta [Hondaea fermentalgiana]|eukprot:GBG30598.1 Beta-hexosaminidase subunit beta [Hondaea fermentalgiana]
MRTKFTRSYNKPKPAAWWTVATLKLRVLLTIAVLLALNSSFSDALEHREPEPVETNIKWDAVPENLPYPLPSHVFHGDKRVSLDAFALKWNVKRCGAAEATQAREECPLLSGAIARYAGLIFSQSKTGVVASCRACVQSINISVKDAESEKSLETDESYILKVSSEGILLTAQTIYGAMHGLETLSQLIQFNAATGTYEIAHADWDIRDAPNFAHRELLVDSSRHYVPLPMLRKILDGMAYCKINVLHWHLVDDQSFPWCSESVPELCQGAYNEMDRYSSSDLREIVAYARERGIRVIPELDVPGHSKSWCRGRPDICTKRGEMLAPAGGAAYEVIFKLMEELHDIFPDRYIHLGGDEVNLRPWSADPATMAYAREKRLNNKGIYQEFVFRTHEKAVSLGLVPVGWEEIYINFGNNLAKSSMVFGWWHTEHVVRAAQAGYNVLNMPIGDWYFDQKVSYKQIRLLDPCHRFGSACKRVLGGGGAAWAEKVDASVLLHTIFPRLAAVAERLWSPTDATGALLERARRFRCHLLQRGIPAAPIPIDQDIHGEPKLRPEVPRPGSCTRSKLLRILWYVALVGTYSIPGLLLLLVFTVNGRIVFGQYCFQDHPWWLAIMFTVMDTLLSSVFLFLFLEPVVYQLREMRKAKVLSASGDKMSKIAQRNLLWSSVTIFTTMVFLTTVSVVPMNNLGTPETIHYLFVTWTTQPLDSAANMLAIMAISTAAWLPKRHLRGEGRSPSRVHYRGTQPHGINDLGDECIGDGESYETAIAQLAIEFALYPSDVLVTLTTGFVKDFAGNDADSVSDQNVILAMDVTSPTFVDAGLDLNNGTLMVMFSEFVNASTWDFSRISLASGGFNVTLDGAILIDTGFGEQVVLQVSEEHRAAVTAEVSAGSDVLITLSTGFVKDFAGNDAVARSNETMTRVDDVTAPAFDFAELDLNSGTLIARFSEFVNTSTLNHSHISLSCGNFVSSLDEATLIETGVREEIVLHLTEEHRAQISAEVVAGYDVVMALTSELVRDFAGNSVVAANNASIAKFDDTTQPLYVSADLDLNDGTLVVIFSEFVNSSTWDYSRISLASGSFNVTLDGATLVDTGVGDVIILHVTEEHRAHITAQVSDGHVVALALSAGFIKDFAENDGVAANDQSVVKIDDTAKPTFVSGDLDLNNGTLIVMLSEFVNATTWDSSRISLTSGDFSAALDGAALIDIGMGNLTVLHLTEEYRAQVTAQVANGNDVFISLTSGFVKDFAGNDLIAISNETMMKKDDLAPPIFVSADLDLNNGTLMVSFSEFVNSTTLNVGGISLVSGNISVALHGSTLLDAAFDKQVVLHMMEEHRAQISAQIAAGYDVLLTLTSGFIRDFAGNNNTAANDESIARIDDATNPAFISANLDLNNGTVLVMFSEFVNATTWDVGRISLSSGDFNETLDEATLIDTDFGDSIALLLAEEHRAHITAQVASENGVFLTLTSGFVQDFAGNNLTAISNQAIGKLDDTTEPTFISADLDLNNGTLMVLFSEFVNSTTWDFSQISLASGDLNAPLDGATLIDTGFGDFLVLLLAEEHRAHITAQVANENGVFLTLSSGFVQDFAGNSLTAVSNQTIEKLDDTTEPTFISADLDLNNGTLVVLFSEFVNASTCDISQISLASGSFNVTLNGAVLIDTGFGEQVVLQVTEEHRAAVTAEVAAGSDVVVALTSKFVQDFAGNSVVAANNASITKVNDTTQPMYTSADLDLNNGTIVVMFSEFVNASTWDFRRILLASGGFNVALDGAIPIDTGFGEQVVLQVTEEHRAAVTAEVAAGSDVLVTLTTGFVKDFAGNDADAVSDQNATLAMDDTAPTFVEAGLDLNNGTLMVMFSEFVNASTWDFSRISLASGGFNVTLNGAVLVDSGFDEHVVLQITEEHRASITAERSAGYDVLITLSMGFVQDFAKNDADAVSDEIVGTKDDKTAPSFASVNLDLNNGILTLVWDEIVNASTWTEDRVSLASGGFNASILGSILLENVWTNTVTLQLPEVQRAAITAEVATSSDVFITLAAGFVQDFAQNDAVGASNELVTKVDDTTSPEFVSAGVDLNNGTFMVLFSEFVNASSWSGTLMSIKCGALDQNLVTAQLLLQGIIDDQIVLQLPEAQRAAVAAEVSVGNNITISLTSGSIQDFAQNDVLQIVDAELDRVDDTTVPLFISADLNLNNGTLVIGFSEFVNSSAWRPSLGTLSSGAYQAYMADAILLNGDVNEFLEIALSEEQRAALTAEVVAGNEVQIALDVDFVRDFAGNAAAALPATAVNKTDDALASSLSDASLDLNIGELVFSFSEFINASTWRADLATLSSGSYFTQLTGATLIDDTVDDHVLVHLTEPQRSELASNFANGTLIYLNLSSGFVSDYAGVHATSLSSYEVLCTADTLSPEFLSAALDCNTGSLALKFDEFVVPPTWNPEGIKLASGTYQVSASSADFLSTVNSESVALILDEAERSEFAGRDKNGDIVAVQVFANLIEDSAGNQLVPRTITATTVSDTTSPNLSSSTLDLNNGTLKVAFSEFVVPSTHNASKLYLASTMYSTKGGEPAALLETTIQDKVRLHFGEIERSLLARAALTDDLQIYLENGFVQDAAANPNEPYVHLVPVVMDATQPFLLASSLDIETRHLMLNFSELVFADDPRQVRILTGDLDISLGLDLASEGEAVSLLPSLSAVWDITLSSEQQVHVANVSANGQSEIVVSILADAALDFGNNSVVNETMSVVVTPDTKPPSILASSIDLGTMIASYNISEYVDHVDLSSVSIQSVTVESIARILENRYSGELVLELWSNDLKDQATLAYLAGGSVTYTLAMGAFADVVGNGISATGSQPFATVVPDTVRPLLLNITVDLGSKEVFAVFDETVTNVSWTHFALQNTNQTATVTLHPYDTAEPASSNIEQLYTMPESVHLAASLIGVDLASVAVLANAFSDLSSNTNLDSVGQPFTLLVQDEVLPEVVGGEIFIDLGTGALRFNLSEHISISSIDLSKILLVDESDGSTHSLHAFQSTVSTGTSYATQLDIIIDVESRIFAVIAHKWAGVLTLRFEAEAFRDASGNPNNVQTLSVAEIVPDLIEPNVTKVDLDLDAEVLHVEFSEPINVTRVNALAETLSETLFIRTEGNHSVPFELSAPANGTPQVFASAVNFPIAESARREMNVAALSASSFRLAYLATSNAFLDAADNAVPYDDSFSSFDVATLTLDTTPPIVEAVTVEIKHGRIIFSGDESLDPSRLDVSKVVIESSLTLDIAECEVQNISSLAEANEFIMSDAQIVLYLPFMDNASDVHMTLLPGVVSDVMGNANTQPFDFVLSPDTTFFETRIMAVNFVQIVRGAVKSIEFIGTGLSSGQSAKWVGGADCTAQGVSLNDGTGSGGHVAITEAGNVGPYRTVSQPISFDVESDPTDFSLCYESELYEAWTMTVFAVQSFSQDSGADDHIVVGVPKSQTFQGVGVQSGDMVKWVTTVDECDEVTAPVHHATNAAAAVSSALRVSNLQIGPRTDASFEDPVLTLCYKFNTEPYFFFEEFTLEVHRVVSMLSTDRLVATQTKTMEFFGVNLAADVDRLVWVQTANASSDADCETEDIQLDLSPGALLTGYQDVAVSIEFAPLPERGYSLCYGFQSEPLRLYTEITLLPCEIVAYNVSQGSHHVAVRDVSKIFYFHGSGFDETVDRISWTSDPSDVDACALYPASIGQKMTGEQYSSGYGPLSFDATIEIAYLCYGFGTSEPWQIYEDVFLQVRAVNSVNLTRTIANLNPPEIVGFTGAYLFADDRAKYVPHVSGLTDTELCALTGSQGATETLRLGSVSFGATAPLAFPAPSASVPYVLCYAHEIEPFALYSELEMQVDGLVSFTPTEYIEGLEYNVNFEAIGLEEDDIVRFIETEDGAAVSDALCETEEAVLTVVIDNPSAQRLVFPQRTSSDTRTHPLCITFRRDMNASLQKIYDVHVRAFGIENASLADVVVGETTEIFFQGTGIAEGDLVKWVSSEEVEDHLDCDSATSLTMSPEGDAMGAAKIASQVFALGTSQAVLCYKFEGHARYRLYENIGLVVNTVYSLSPPHAIVNSTQTMVLDLAMVRAGDKVRFVPEGSSCNDEDVQDMGETLDVKIVVCEQVSAPANASKAPYTNKCAQISPTFLSVPSAGTSVFLCYKFAREASYASFPDVRVRVVAPTLTAQSSNFFVSGVSKTLELTGSFGISSGDKYKFVEYDVESCDNATDVAEKSVLTTVLGDDDALVSGTATLEVDIDIGTVDEANLLKHRPYRLCYRFGASGPMLLYKQRTLTGLKLSKVLLATRPDSVVAGAEVVFEFHGQGVADGDTAKWVGSGDACDADGAAGSSAQLVIEQRASFRFDLGISDLLLCYKFQDEPFVAFPSLVLGRVAYDEMVVSASSSNSSTTTAEDAALSSEEVVSEKLLEEQTKIDSKLQQEARLTISLDRDFAELKPGSEAESTFKASFVEDMRKSLGIPSDRIRITGLSSGSVIVNFIILPPTSDDDTLPAETAAAILVEKVLDIDSDLYTESAVLGSVKRDVPVEVVVLPNEDALARANETATAQLAQQESDLEIVDYQEGGLVIFAKAVKVAVEEFDSYVDLRVLREHGSSGTLHVDYTTRDGTALAGVHYTQSEGSLAFRDKETEKTIRIPILRDDAVGPPFRWFVAELSLPRTYEDAKLGTRTTALVKIFDFGDGEQLVGDAFTIESGTSNETHGWSVSHNVVNEATNAWVDVHGLFSADKLYASEEYNERCDFASSIGPCTYSCEYGGSYALSSGRDDGVLELSGSESSYVASAEPWDSSITTAFTISMWVRMAEGASLTGRETMLSYQVAGQSGLNEIALVNPSDLTLVVHGRVDALRLSGESSGIDVSDGAWHFIAVSWTSAGGEVFFYHNGLLAAEVGPLRADTAIVEGGAWVVGQAQGAEPCFTRTGCSFVPGRAFNGTVQNVRVWSQARSLEQVQGGMRWPFTLYQGSLHLYWRFRVDDSILGVVSNIALAGGDHDGLLGAGAILGDGAPSAHQNYPCGKVHQNVFYFEAPARYQGDLRNVYNGRLQFELFSSSQHGTPRDMRGTVVLEGGGLVLSNALLGFPTTTQSSGWRGYSLVLQEDQGWIVEPSGAQATFEEFWSVLRNVTRLGIRGDLMEYSREGSGQETTYLNNVALIKV